MGNAILMAAEMIKTPLLESASEILGLPVEQLIARNRLIYDRDNPDHCIELKEAAKRSMMPGRRMMGLGYALMEELVIKDGITQNLSFQDYIIPTSMDIPEIILITVEHPNVHGPFGAKGIGEMPNIPAAPAITNAIANATGARIYDLPAHSERVCTAIKDRLNKKV
jgi:xanthine dehydrogenase molybdopterin-binding subunit B